MSKNKGALQSSEGNEKNDNGHQEEKTECVLLVEDDHALRAMLKNVLEMEGFATLEADTRHDAMAYLNDSSRQIKVMVLDLGLPPKAHTTDEGLDVIKEVATKLLATKIIVLTGQDEEKSALDAIREGAFDFLAKPATAEDILNSVNRAFLFHRKEQDLSASGVKRLQLSAKVAAGGLKAVREDAEEKLVRQVLKDTGFNIYQTAAKLGIKRESIYYFMKKFGIHRDSS